MPDADGGQIKPRIHDRGDRRLDSIRTLIEEAGRPRPVGEVLAVLCREIAVIAAVDVVSVYVLEASAEGEALVIRGNVGFPAAALGSVRLRIGEGLTGVVAECLQPVSLAVAQQGERYHHVDGIGEERFPAYLGLPLLARGRIAGVLVLQRREAREFAPEEIALAASLAAPVGYALERAGLVAAPPRTTTLAGRGHGDGVAVGRVAVLPALETLIAENVPRGHDAGRLAALALASLARELGRTARRLAAAAGAKIDGQLRALSMLIEDECVRDFVIAECRAAGAAEGLASVTREYARSPYRVPGTERSGRWLAERPMEVEDLCLLIGGRIVGRLLPAAHSVLVASRLSGVIALAGASHGTAAVVVAGSAAESELGLAVAGAARIPVVTDVPGLFAGIRADDQALVDGPEGRVLVNPPAAAIAALRR